MVYQTYSSTAFVLSLIGGIVIVVGGLMSLLFYSYGGWPYYGGMMGGWSWMGGYGYSSSAIAFSVIGLVSGIIVIIGALMLNTRPAEHTAWGVIILIFSMVSFIGMGGFFIGAILGIAGGALALSFRPVSKQ